MILISWSMPRFIWRPLFNQTLFILTKNSNQKLYYFLIFYICFQSFESLSRLSIRTSPNLCFWEILVQCYQFTHFFQYKKNILLIWLSFFHSLSVPTPHHIDIFQLMNYIYLSLLFVLYNYTYSSSLVHKYRVFELNFKILAW